MHNKSCNTNRFLLKVQLQTYQRWAKLHTEAVCALLIPALFELCCSVLHGSQQSSESGWGWGWGGKYGDQALACKNLERLAVQSIPSVTFLPCCNFPQHIWKEGGATMRRGAHNQCRLPPPRSFIHRSALSSSFLSKLFKPAHFKLR